jgi:hypothetical protein
VKGVQGFVAKNQSALYQAIGKPIGEIQHISGNHIFPMTMHIKDILHVLDEPPRPDYKKNQTTRDEDALILGTTMQSLTQEREETINDRLIPNIERAIEGIKLLLEHNGYSHEGNMVQIDPSSNERETAEAILMQLQQLQLTIGPIQKSLESIGQESAASYVTRLFPGADPEKALSQYGPPELKEFVTYFKGQKDVSRGTP